MNAAGRILLVAAAAAILLAGAGWAILRKLRISPAERERRRRLAVNRMGRMIDGFVTDVDSEAIYYSYSVHGVEYMASQEIGDLRGLVPESAALLIGHATLKYVPRNPANSILVCEHWSGLRGDAGQGRQDFAGGLTGAPLISKNLHSAQERESA